MPYIPNLVATNVANPTLLTSAQPRDRPAMPAAAQTTTLPCASGRRHNDNPTTLPKEVTEGPEVPEALEEPVHLGKTGPNVEDVLPVSASADICTTTDQAIDSPTEPPIAIPTVHLPIGMTDLIADIPLLILPGQPRDHPSTQCRNLNSKQRFPVH